MFDWIAGDSEIGANLANLQLYSQILLMKRFFDIFATIILACALSLPLLLLCGIQLAILGRPIFFRQQRAGRKGQPLSILKFRTMRTGVGSDAARLIPWGKFLRSTSIDELPELWNVLRGEMSLVGPRPLPITYLERYSAAQVQRHDVRPGITGWAQINGRNGLTWKRQFELDLWYVNHRTFWLDLKILILTVVIVFRRENISEQGQATRSEFFGNEE
jgi:lipopolysaccharide/colanic/teichoic acid biosynthesis glycosyltransferase